MLKRILEDFGIDSTRRILFCFDVDELLVSNKRHIEYAYDKLLFERRIYKSSAHNGRNLFGILRNMKCKYNIKESIEDLALERKFWYTQALNRTPPALMNGVEELFSGIEEYNSVVCYATSSQDEFMSILIKTSLENLSFNFGVSWREDIEKKPSPDIYNECLEISGVDNSQAVAFEDSISGAKSAIAAGIKTILIPSSKEARLYFSENKSVKILNSLKQLTTKE